MRPSFAISPCPSKDGGRRESRVRAAPAVSRARCAQEHAHEHTGSAESIRPSLRNGFTAYSALSPATNSCCHRRLRIDDFAHPGRARKISAGLTSATDARTTRLRRTQQPPPPASTGHVPAAEVFGEGVEAPFVRAPVDRSQETCPAIPFARPTLPRPPHLNPRS